MLSETTLYSIHSLNPSQVKLGHCFRAVSVWLDKQTPRDCYVVALISERYNIYDAGGRGMNNTGIFSFNVSEDRH